MAQHQKIFFYFAISLIIVIILTGLFFVLKKKFNLINKKDSITPGYKYVILVHGFFRSPASMSRIEDTLKKKGFKVINYGYPRRSKSVEDIAKNLDNELKRLPENYKSINFVTHSLGTIVVRYYLNHYNVQKLGRFVMIAPPNRGSELARLFEKFSFSKWISGNIIDEIKQSPDSLPRQLAPPQCEFGIISGGLGNKYGFNPFIPGDDDMTIGVSETKLKGMKDFIQIKGQHSILLLQKRVIDNIISFLEDGVFLHETNTDRRESI